MKTACCRRLARALQCSCVPVEYDAVRSEYRIALSTRGYSVMSYCPFCGSQFPVTEGDPFYLEPNKLELQEIEKLVGIVDMEELCERLGGPTDVVESDGMVQYHFAKWSTVELIVQQADEGGLDFIAVPRPRKSQEEGAGEPGSERDS